MAIDHLPSFVNYLYISSDHVYTVVLKFFIGLKEILLY